MALLFAGLLVVSAAAVGVAPAAGATADQFITMTSSTTPSQPTTDGEFTFTMSLHSTDQSDGAVTVERIEVREGSASDDPLLAERAYTGRQNPTLKSGSTLDESFSLSFDEPGPKELFVEVTFDTGTRLVTTTYRTNVTVYRPNPGIQVSAEPTTAGERTTITVDVANGLEGAIRDVELSIAADRVEFDDTDRVASSVASGETSTFSFTGTPATLGSHEVEVALSYTTADGTRRHVTRTVDVGLRAPDFEGDIGLSAAVTPAIPGATTSLNLTLTNGLDVAIRQMDVQVSADGATFRQNGKVATGFESGSQRTFRFDVSRESTGRQSVDVVVSFTTANGVEGQVTETLSTRFDAPANPGEVRLTGVSATRSGGQIEISATASNVGSSEVSSVIVSVGEDAPVARADYFVGNIEGGDFASFTLTSSVRGNLSSVPVTVTYVVDDIEHSTTTEIPVEGRAVPSQSRNSDGGGGGGLPIVVGAVLLVAVAGAALVYRRRG